MNKAETRIIKAIAEDHIQMYKDNNGDYVFVLKQIPQSLNKRDSSRWFQRREYQAIWDGFMWRALRNCPFKDELPLEMPFIAVYQPYRQRFFDMDNSGAGIKSVMDAFVHMGVIPNDDPEHFYHYIPMRPIKVAKKKDEYVEIRLIPCPKDSRLRFEIVRS